MEFNDENQSIIKDNSENREIANSDISKTPAMAQFFEIKKNYPDSILFFRMGDFYEMFDDDAVVASKILGIALTKRNKKSANPIPLCGIPYHSYMPYLIKLLKAGKKVAICEQLEDPKTVKGIVKRGVTRIVTPATVVEEEAQLNFDNNFLLSIYATINKAYIVAIDVTTGETFLKNLPIEKIEDSVGGWVVKEIISNTDISLSQITATKRNPVKSYDKALNKVLSHYNITSEKALFIDDPNYIWALSMALDYLDDLILTTKLMLPVTLSNIDHLIIDNIAATTLELVESKSGNDNTLFNVLNETSTPMGTRFLKNSILRPLRDINQINHRLDIITYFLKKPSFLAEIKNLLNNVYDIERIIGRLLSNKATPKDLIWLKISIQNIPLLNETLQDESILFSKFEMEGQEEIYNLIEKSINNEPPATIKEGDIIKHGFNSEIDELRNIKNHSKEIILSIEDKERRNTGINQLKIGYNKVFGYFIEVSKLNASKVPDYFERKQTLANAERYIIPELKELETKILSAEDNLSNIEYHMFIDIRNKVTSYADKLRILSRKIAEIDFLVSLAYVAKNNNYTVPNINENGIIKITEGRHPIIETNSKVEFVPNDFELDKNNSRLLIITGPNMSGKSTYLRSCALISIMAHMGSYVPAKSADISILDRVFTRVGASDNIAKGESTFMVEMVETANILTNATKNSLIILDEIGRGTSTFDGISIAWAVSEYILNNIGAKTLFATHYYELTELGNAEGACNYTVSIEEWNNEVIFLRKVIKGITDKSYGIYVGKMAGLPENVIKRANEVLSELENYEEITLMQEKQIPKQKQKFVQPILVFDDSHPVVDELKSIDIDNITPIQAMQILSDLKKKVIQ